MKNKEIIYGSLARKKIKAGVDKLAKAVSVTLGPRGRHALIKRSWGAPHVTRDGVTIAKEIYLKDTFEDMGAQMVKAAATKTCDEAGDGTTTATVLAQAIYNEGLQLLTAGFNPVDLRRGIDKAVLVVVKNLEAISKPTQDPEEIAQIGTISANDEEIGKLIAEGMEKVGKEGVITIEESGDIVTKLEFSEGMQFDRGYMSHYFITDAERVLVEFTDPFILIHDSRIEEIETLVPLLEAISRAGKSLLVIAEDYSQKVLATLLNNKIRGALFSCPVKAPGFGERRKEILRDLCALTGATLFTSETGMTFEKGDLMHLGQAKRIITTRGNTTIVGGMGKKEDIKARANQIRKDIERSETEYDKKMARDRLAKLIGGVAVIRVGAPTEPEIKEKKDRVEDAVHATRAAVEEGIVPGGGIALLRCIPEVLKLVNELDKGEREGAKIILNSLKAPLRTIVQNAGGKPDVIEEKVMESNDLNFGYNAAKDCYEDLIVAGIIDPKKVVRCALQNAASVASMLITTEAMVSEESEDTNTEE